MDVKVDRDIPVPRPKRTGVTALLRTLKPGDSVLLDSLHAPALAFRIFGKGHFRSHKEHGGIRIWRTEGKK